MKNLRLFLPLFLLGLIILIFTGCGGVIPSPGTTEDVTIISGKIKMPFTCCTIDEPIIEEPIGHYTDTWSIIPEALVELRDARECNKLLASTFADETGYYEFKDIEPGLYIITAYCPVQKNYIFKDVAEKKEGIPLDAGIPDCDSTSLALVIEYIQECFGNSNCFRKSSSIYRLVRDITGDIGEVNIPLIEGHEDFGNLDDEDYNDLVDLVCNQLMGCCIGPGFTPGPEPTPNPCAGNEAPVLDMPDDDSVNPGGSYSWDVDATDDDITGTLTFSLVSVSPDPTNDFTINATSGQISWDPTCVDIVDGDTTYTITVGVDDGCTTVQDSFEVTLLAEQCDPCYNNKAPYNLSLDNLTVIAGQAYSGTVTAEDDDGDTLTFAFSDGHTPPTGMTIDSATGVISWTPGLDDICYCSQEQVLSARQQSRIAANPYDPCSPIRITVSDHCGFTDEEFCLEVQSPCVNNEVPTLTMPNDDSVDPNPDNPYTWNVTANDDGIKDPLVFSLVSVTPTPSNNFSINATSGQISWDPTCVDIVDGDTTYTITVGVDDGCTTVQDSFEVTLLWEYCQTFTVTYDGNGNDGGTVPSDPNSPYYAGDTVTVLSGVPTKDNYTFDGWLYDGDIYIANDTFTMPAANVTLVAQWTENDKYNVYYDNNGGTGTQTDNNDYYEGDTVTVLDEGTMEKTNYTFNGWNTAADGNGTAYSALDTFSMPASDVTLYAQWIENTKYTVTYDGNGNDGGTVPSDPNSPYYAGDTVTVLSGVPTKDNYTFDGWLYDGDIYIANDTFTMPAANVTLVAQWKAIDYYVYYYGNGNDSGSAPIDGFNPYNVGDTVYVLGNTGNLAKIGGYTFDSWNTESDGTGTSYSADDTFSMPAKDVELYAQWECNLCCGWDATGVTVYLWYAGSHGHSDPRIDVDGAITGPSCANITEIDIQFILYNKGGNIKETYTDTLTSVNNSFSVELNIDPASYNAGDNYKLYVSVPNCGLILVKSGTI